jgi:hypothetical protein
MAYDIYIQPAFMPPGATEGWDYQSADELIKKVTEASAGRCYIDEEGILVYESMNVRPA